MKINKRHITIVILIALFFLLSGCSNETDKNGIYKSNISKGEQEITIFAAASLTESIKELKNEFEKNYPGIKVQLNLAATSRLRVQIEQGALADIFLSANKEHYDRLKEEGFIVSGKEFLSNSLVVVVPKDNPANINELKHLADRCKLVIAHENVPVGGYTLQCLEKLEGKYGKDYKEKVLENVVSKENNVKHVVTKVVLGEADAGFVYLSDVTPDVKDKVKTLYIPEEYNVDARYWAVLLKGREANQKVRLLYNYIIGEQGKKIFNKYGFGLPED